ncbi:unnamed protein product [Callosobruchus maculatus]|uniref:YqaJ viral recombinase domain-containing protein n=1 Tax=Callosobruchus maculatus TaxID=64391 RepID=A0A653CH45_CALMS|nr:unnamed protein product [Callosobruchus maculatus]
MLSPNVSEFLTTYSQFHIDKFEGKVEKSFSKFYYNHVVNLFVPDILKIPDAVIEELTVASNYYKVSSLNLKELLEQTFLSNFIRSGKLTLLSINTRIDCDNCVAITPTGFLVLTVDKETYTSLGIEGNASHHLADTQNRYRKCLEQEVRMQVEKLKNIKIEKCGFFLSNEHSILGVSPDGVTEEHVVEIKCPVKKNNITNYINSQILTPKCEAQVQL